MSTAGAVLSVNDPVIEDVRELMGVSAPDPVAPEMLITTPEPTDEEIAEDEDEEEIDTTELLVDKGTGRVRLSRGAV